MKIISSQDKYNILRIKLNLQIEVVTTLWNYNKAAHLLVYYSAVSFQVYF